MPVVNSLAREVVLKIVYCGPGLGGKTTSLTHVHATTKPEFRGKMVSLATPVDRTLYFDFLPIRVPNLGSLTVRLQLFTVPGQVSYNATRKLVLAGADGVVFVADSQLARTEANLESLRNLQDNLRDDGRRLADIPHVLQYNKRDLADLAPIEDLEQLLNPHAAPSFASVAITGEGVYEVLEAITRAVLDELDQRMPEHRDMALGATAVPEGGLADALRQVDDIGSSMHDAQLTYAEPQPAGGMPTMPAPVEGPAILGDQALPTPAEFGTRPGVGSFRAPRRDLEPTPDDSSLAPEHSASGGSPTHDLSLPAGFSMSRLWPQADRARVKAVEADLASGDWASAVAADSLNGRYRP
jgi:signal recognition particle receptor subunit beta